VVDEKYGKFDLPGVEEYKGEHQQVEAEKQEGDGPCVLLLCEEDGGVIDLVGTDAGLDILE
jgi:hypothetical protein